MSLGFWPDNMVITGNTITSNTTHGIPLTFTTGGLARSWSVMRTHVGLRRWRWTASGPKGSDSGYALSEAVARSRALRAYEELA